MAVKQYIISIIVMLVFASNAVFARECSDKVYLINLFYDENFILNFEGAYQGVGCYPESNLLYPYTFEIKKDGISYYSTSFDYKVIYTDVLDGSVVVGGIKNAYKTKFTLVVPYRENIDGFDVKEGETVLLSVDKSIFYENNQKKSVNQGLFDWVDNLIKSVLGSLFS